MKAKILLEKEGKWSIVPCKFKGDMLETGTRNFRYDAEEAALAAIPKDFVEVQHNLMPAIFGDSYRRIFISKEDFESL